MSGLLTAFTVRSPCCAQTQPWLSPGATRGCPGGCWMPMNNGPLVCVSSCWPPVAIGCITFGEGRLLSTGWLCGGQGWADRCRRHCRGPKGWWVSLPCWHSCAMRRKKYQLVWEFLLGKELPLFRKISFFRLHWKKILFFTDYIECGMKQWNKMIPWGKKAMGMCGAGKAEDRGEGRGKREKEGELGRTRTRVRRTRNLGGETNGGVCSQAHARARWAWERPPS